MDDHTIDTKHADSGHSEAGNASVGDRSSYINTESNASLMLKPHGQIKSNSDNPFLSAPLQLPLRPLSPDSFAFSADEYEQLNISRRPSRIAEDLRTRPELSQGWRGKLSASWVHNKGCALMLLSQMFGTSMNVLTRILEMEGNEGKGLHPFQVLFVRMSITVILSCAYMWYKQTPHFPFGAPGVRWLLIARGLSGFFGVTGMYWSLLYLPLADATVITFLAPGLICWVCSKLLKEPFTRAEVIGTFISFIGVIFIARPTSLFHALMGSPDPPPASGTGDMAPSGTDDSSPASDTTAYKDPTPEQRLFAVVIALVGVAGTVVALTTIRWIGKRAHPLISVNYFATWCTLVSFTAQLTIPSIGFVFPANVHEWSLLLSLGACGFIMQALLAAALSYEKSSRATNMVYTQMFFALAADRVIFGAVPEGLSILGSLLILGSAVVVALQKGEGGKNSGQGLEGERDAEAQMALLADGEDGERELGEVVQLRSLDREQG